MVRCLLFCLGDCSLACGIPFDRLQRKDNYKLFLSDNYRQRKGKTKLKEEKRRDERRRKAKGGAAHCFSIAATSTEPYHHPTLREERRGEKRREENKTLFLSFKQLNDRRHVLPAGERRPELEKWHKTARPAYVIARYFVIYVWRCCFRASVFLLLLLNRTMTA